MTAQSQSNLVQVAVQAAISALFQTFVESAQKVVNDAGANQVLHCGATMFTIRPQEAGATAHEDVLILGSFGNDPHKILEVAGMMENFAHQQLGVKEHPLLKLFEQLGAQRLESGMEGVEIMALDAGDIGNLSGLIPPLSEDKNSFKPSDHAKADKNDDGSEETRL